MIGRRGCLGLLGAAALPGMGRAQAGDAGWGTPAPDVPAVSLTDQDGRRWPFRELVRGRPAVAVGFFFTACSVLCPPQTAAMMALQEALAARTDLARPAAPLLLTVSLDPLGDVPEAMRAYADRFGAVLGLPRGWLMLTGELPALARVWAAFEAPGASPQDHAAMLWLARDGGRAWRRTSAMGPTQELADLLLASGGAG